MPVHMSSAEFDKLLLAMEKNNSSAKISSEKLVESVVELTSEMKTQTKAIKAETAIPQKLPTYSADTLDSQSKEQADKFVGTKAGDWASDLKKRFTFAGLFDEDKLKSSRNMLSGMALRKIKRDEYVKAHTDSDEFRSKPLLERMKERRELGKKFNEDNVTRKKIKVNEDKIKIAKEHGVKENHPVMQGYLKTRETLMKAFPEDDANIIASQPKSKKDKSSPSPLAAPSSPLSSEDKDESIRVLNDQTKLLETIEENTRKEKGAKASPPSNIPSLAMPSLPNLFPAELPEPGSFDIDLPSKHNRIKPPPKAGLLSKVGMAGMGALEVAGVGAAAAIGTAVVAASVAGMVDSANLIKKSVNGEKLTPEEEDRATNYGKGSGDAADQSDYITYLQEEKAKEDAAEKANPSPPGALRSTWNDIKSGWFGIETPPSKADQLEAAPVTIADQLTAQSAENAQLLAKTSTVNNNPTLINAPTTNNQTQNIGSPTGPRNTDSTSVQYNKSRFAPF